MCAENALDSDKNFRAAEDSPGGSSCQNPGDVAIPRKVRLLDVAVVVDRNGRFRTHGNVAGNGHFAIHHRLHQRGVVIHGEGVVPFRGLHGQADVVQGQVVAGHETEVLHLARVLVEVARNGIGQQRLNRRRQALHSRSQRHAFRKLVDDGRLIGVNADHLAVIEAQKKRLGTKNGFIAVKPNCSIQSYVPALTPLLEFEPEKVSVCTYQAISGAGKTFKTWPEMVDNVIPYIGGEDEKSENEPLKLWGHVEDGKIVNAALPVISAQCLRVACSDGHMAAVSVSFKKKPTIEQIKERWANYETEAQRLELPSAPKPFLQYFEDPSRPQTRLDRDFQNGFGVSIGRLREDKLFDYRFVCLSHNTVRGAAGGGILTAELLCRKGYIPHRV